MYDIRDVTWRGRRIGPMIVRYVETRAFHPLWVWLALGAAIVIFAFTGNGP